MKKAGKKRRRENRRFQRGIIFLIICSVLMCAGIFILINMVIEPNMEDVARIRAEVVVSRTINKALAKQFAEEKDKELFTVVNGEDGSMAMVQADSAEINIMLSQLSINLQEAFREMKDEYLDVPVGTLLGSKLLSQTGPDVTVSIVPLSVSSMDFRTEFESQGINQTKYKIYIVVGSKVKIMSPFAAETFETSSNVLVAEAVILGKVPESFVQVPEEDILDVTQE